MATALCDHSRSTSARHLHTKKIRTLRSGFFNFVLIDQIMSNTTSAIARITATTARMILSGVISPDDSDDAAG